MKQINEEHLGADATEAQARQMVALLRERGYEVKYGPADIPVIDGVTGEEINHIHDAVWSECLGLIAMSKKQRSAAATAKHIAVARQMLCRAIKRLDESTELSESEAKYKFAGAMTAIDMAVGRLKNVL